MNVAPLIPVCLGVGAALMLTACVMGNRPNVKPVVKAPQESSAFDRKGYLKKLRADDEIERDNWAIGVISERLPKGLFSADEIRAMARAYNAMNPRLDRPFTKQQLDAIAKANLLWLLK